MKGSKRISLVAVVFTFVVFSLGIVNADSVIKMINASIDPEITLKIDGTQIIPADANGKEVPILVYEGTSYLPVRSVAEEFGAEVSWDAETKTIGLVSDPINLDNPTILDLQKADRVKLNKFGEIESDYNVVSLLKDTKGTGVKFADSSTGNEDIFEYTYHYGDTTQYAKFPTVTVETNGHYRTMKGYLKLVSIGELAHSEKYYKSSVVIYDIKNQMELYKHNFFDDKIEEGSQSDYIQFECDVTDVDEIAIIALNNVNFEETEISISGIEFSK